MKIAICLFFIASAAFAQNLVPINPGAESGSLTGWVSQTVAFGGVQPADPLNSVSIISDPNFITEGTSSFWIHDGSTSTSQEMLSSASNRVQLNANTNYLFTFDIKIAPIPNAPTYPLLQLRYWSAPVGGNLLLQRAFDLSSPSAFSSVTPVINGFNRYAITDFISSGGPSPLPAPVYCEFDFFSDFYASSRSDMYIDNITTIIVPEPSGLILSILGGLGVGRIAWRNRYKRSPK